jgi:O-antigen/teichoic acid export membrane protein
VQKYKKSNKKHILGPMSDSQIKQRPTAGLLKNTGISGLCLIATKIIRMAFIAWCVAGLGSAQWGEVAFALALTSYLLMLTDAGRSTLSSLHRVNSASDDQQFLNSLFWGRLLFAVPVYLILTLTVQLFPFEGSTALLIYGLVVLIKPFSLEWLYYRKMHSGLMNMIQLSRHLLVISLVLLLPGDLSLPKLLWAEVFAEGVTVVVAFLKFPHPLPSLKNFTWSAEWALLKKSSVFLLIAGFSLLHLSGDILVLRAMVPLSQLGVYDIAYKLVTFVLVAGTSFTLAMRPRLAEVSDAGATAPLPLIRAAQSLLFAGGLSFWFLFMLCGHWVFNFILPQNPEAGMEVVAVLAVYLMFTFSAIPLAEWVQINYTRKIMLIMILIAGCSNILLNILLIPLFSLQGAALATVVVEFGILSYLFYKTRFFSLKQLYFLIVPLIILALEFSNLKLNPWHYTSLFLGFAWVGFGLGLFRLSHLREIARQ